MLSKFSANKDKLRSVRLNLHIAIIMLGDENYYEGFRAYGGGPLLPRPPLGTQIDTRDK
jgi:hypothetical protein